MSESPKPTVLLLYGDDRLAIEEQLTDLITRLGDPSTAAASLQRFTASRLDLDALRRHLYAIPFLAPRRMALLELAPFPGKKNELPDSFLAVLDSIPPSSILVATEAVEYDEAEKLLRRSRQGRSADALHRLHASHSPVFAWIEGHPQQGLARELRSPRGKEFERWLHKRAAHFEGKIEPEAAAVLREFTGDDTLLADQELRKLLDFVDRARPIAQPDVVALTPARAESDVFAMVELLGVGNGHQAMAQLRRMLEAEDPRYLFSMIVRQFRLLLLARESLDAGRAPDLVLTAPPHRLPRFVAERVARQALRFTGNDLSEIYFELADLDLASKTGRADLAVGLEVLVGSLAR